MYDTDGILLYRSAKETIFSLLTAQSWCNECLPDKEPAHTGWTSMRLNMLDITFHPMAGGIPPEDKIENPCSHHSLHVPGAIDHDGHVFLARSLPLPCYKTT
jgi:hypothetical protein